MTVPNTILSSTLLLTLLLLVGLVFFIRASTKDRTEVATYVVDQADVVLLERLQQYFESRAYRVEAVNPEDSQITLKGWVRPSVFLAVFLSALAGVGALCLALILAFAFNRESPWFLSVLLLAPTAGLFYWTRAGREEKVSFQLMSRADADAQSTLRVTAHRDELAQLQSSLELNKWEVDL